MAVKVMSLQRCIDHWTLYDPNIGCSICREEDTRRASQLASGMKEGDSGLCKRGDMGKLRGERLEFPNDGNGQ
jgi:hypothetical protein